MRAISRGAALDNAFMTLVVRGGEGRAHVVYDKLRKAGYDVAVDLPLEMRRADKARVLQVLAAGQETALLELHTESERLLKPSEASGCAQASFQPIWAIWLSSR